jgi:hypothetical protein
MASKPKPQPNLILADSVEAWGTKYGQLEDGYVSGLISALREDKDLHIWASFNPAEYLPVPLVASASRIANWVRFLTVIRNVLVFAPVALTWLAVGEATKGFQEYISQNTTGVANFLDFWQNGYGILPDEYKISHVAELDAILILIVIALTLVVSILGVRAEKQSNGTEAFSERERTNIAIEIGLYFYDEQKPSASTVNASVAASVARLRASTTALESSSKSLAGTAKNLVSATKALEQSAKEIASKKGKKVSTESASDRFFDQSNYQPEKFDLDNFEFEDSIHSKSSPKKKWKFRESS